MSLVPASIPSVFDSVPVAVVVQSLKQLLIAVVFSSFLIPAAIVLFVSSTPAIRRRPSFILNVCAIGLGLTQGAVTAYAMISEMVNTLPRTSLISINVALYVGVPVCVQTTLLLRVLAVYPPRQLSRPLCLAMYGPVIAMKAARIVNASYLIYAVQQSKGNSLSAGAAEGAAVWTSPFAKSEMFLQLIDDVYVSALFLLRLQMGIKFAGSQSRMRGSHAQEPSGGPGPRLRTLFWIALSNFVFPVIFDIAQLVLIFRDKNYIQGGYVVSTNTYISILGVLFSTIWASGSRRMGEASPQTALSWRHTPSPHDTLVVGHLVAPPRSLSRSHVSFTVCPQTKPIGLSNFKSQLDNTLNEERDFGDDQPWILHGRAV